jgi:hypothetical protein
MDLMIRIRTPPAIPLNITVVRIMTAVAFLLSVIPASAHHSFAAVYDQSKPLRVDGVVQRVDWRNPHVTIALTAKDAAGAEVQWEFELGAPRVLTSRFGWADETVKIGDHISVEGYLARAGDQQAAAVTITTRTGARLTAVQPFR